MTPHISPSSVVLTQYEALSFRKGRSESNEQLLDNTFAPNKILRG